MVIPLPQLLRMLELHSGRARPGNVHEEVVLGIIRGERDPFTDWHWYCAEAFLRWELDREEDNVICLQERLEEVLHYCPQAEASPREDLPDVSWGSTPGEFESFWTKWREHSEALTRHGEASAARERWFEESAEREARLRRNITTAESRAQALGDTRRRLLSRYPAPPGVPMPQGDSPWEVLVRPVPSPAETEDFFLESSMRQDDPELPDEPEYLRFLWPAVPEGLYELRRVDDDFA